MTKFNQNIAPEGKRWVVVVDGNYYSDYDDRRLAMRDVEYLKEDGYEDAHYELRGSEW